ncbi:MAG: hypothetical protein KBT03_09765 [Bacteroidales bacterium]|nr:hypothetical protein [Candidatus Scybalousia scybalohippi]
MFNKVDVKSLAVWSYQRGRVDAIRAILNIISCHKLETIEERINLVDYLRNIAIEEETKLKEVE